MSEGEGWNWFERPSQLTNDEVNRHFRQCFATASGQFVLKHLRKQYLERRLGANATAEELRHLEGARCAVTYIEKLATLRSFEENMND